MKILKIVLAIGAICAVLLGGVLAYVAATFDPNSFKPQIIALVKEKKQRTLTLQGDIKLKFFPSIGADLGKVALSEFNSDKPFASVDSARVSLKLMPLLSRKAVVDEIQVRGVSATLVKYKDGKTNIDDLLSKDDTKSQAVEFDIDHVDIENAALSYRDEAQNASYALTEVNLKSGRIAPAVPGKIELSMKLRGDQPKLDLAVALKTKLTFDLDNQVFDLDGMSLEAKGLAAGISNLNFKAAGSVNAKVKAGELATDGLTATVSGVLGTDNLEAKLDAPKLMITREKAAGDKVVLTAKLSNAQGSTQVNLQLPGVSGTAQAFSAAAMTLDLDMARGSQTIKAQLRSPVSGDFQKQQLSLPGLTLEVKGSGPGLPGQSLAGSLSGNASIDGAAQQVRAQLAGKVAASTIKAQFGVNGFAPPAINFDIDIDQLDVDQFTGGDKKAGAGGAKGTGGAGAEQPFDLSALRSLRANGKLRIGALKASGLKASNVDVEIRAAGGQVDVSPLSANLYQGSMKGAVSVNAAPAIPQFAIKQNLSGIAVGPLLKDLADKDLLEGSGSVTVDVHTQGSTVSALKHALSGNAAVNLRDGAVKGIDVAGTIRDVRAKLGSLTGQHTQQTDKNQKTDFSELSGTFAIQNGVAHNSDLQLKSPLLRIGGAGDINIGDDTLNYMVKASVVGTLAGQGGQALNDLKGVTVPVRASGPLTAPSFALDFNALLTDTVKQKAEDAVRSKLEEQLLGKKPAAPAAPGAAPQSNGDAAKNALKGLFGR